jgi:RNA polymerase sigma-70 factor, ECF subfamily
MSESMRVARGAGRATSGDDLSGLVAATARGDRGAFRRLYDLTHRKLYSVAFLLVRRRDAAEDALQDSYLRVWTKAASFDPAKGSAIAWLARIVRNVALDRLRQEKLVTEELDERVDAIAVEPASVFELHEFNKCLLALSPHQREALLLTYFGGLSREEVAERLQAPVGTVKSWVFRGSERLKAAIGV